MAQSPKAKIAVIYYSTYGHITKLTEEIVDGARSTGAQVDVFQIPETLPAEVLAKQGAIPRPDVPVITPEQLPEYDGFIFGSPTRYGRVTAQVSAFFDRTGKLWDKGALVGKFATMYTSTASQHGGIEETALTTMPFFFHHGISYVPLGYTNEDLTNVSEIIGASASGAGTIAGPTGERNPTAIDLKVARHHGGHFANIVNTYVVGKHALSSQ